MRDVLPDEMRELRVLTERLRDVFDGAGYGEVWTPALEYEDVLRPRRDRAAPLRYRMFDEHGHVLALRSDDTSRSRASSRTATPTPSRRCASVTSRTPTARVKAAQRSRASSSRAASS